MTYANSNDRAHLIAGYVAAGVAGVALPAFTFLFGDVVNGIGNNDASGVIKQAENMLYIGIGVFFFAWWYVAFLSILADRIA